MASVSIWYKAMPNYLAINFDRVVTPVKASKVTDASIWVGGRRVSKQSKWACYFSTKQEAIDFVVRTAEWDLARARRNLDRANNALEKAKKLSEDKS